MAVTRRQIKYLMFDSWRMDLVNEYGAVVASLRWINKDWHRIDTNTIGNYLISKLQKMY